MIQLRGLSKTYIKRKDNGDKSHFKALDDIDFEIEKGKVYSIVGESGSGKSTLAKIISGIELHDVGDFTYKTQVVKSKKFFNKKDVRKNIQLVQQDTFSALNPRLSVMSCILEPIRNLCSNSVLEECEQVKVLLNQVELNESFMFRKAAQLSGGQQKRVNIARAMSSNPELLILDEATSGLDVVVKKKILDLLKSIQKETQCSLLFITHDMEVAMYMSDHISVMEKGKIVEQVVYKGGLDCFKHSYSKHLIKSTFL